MPAALAGEVELEPADFLCARYRGWLELAQRDGWEALERSLSRLERGELVTLTLAYPTAAEIAEVLRIRERAPRRKAALVAILAALAELE